MINFLRSCVLGRPAQASPVVVPPALPVARPEVTGMADLPPELWLLGAQCLQPADRAAFLSTHPQKLLAIEAQGSAAVATIRNTEQVAVVSGLLEQTQGLPALQRVQILTNAARWACRQLVGCACGPASEPLHDLLATCLQQADTLPTKLKNRVLCVLLLRLPHPYCDHKNFVQSRQGAFATRLITDVLAAARSGDPLVCRAVGRSARGLPRLIDLEYGIAPRLGHMRERAARAVEFMAVLAQAETVAGGEVGEALATASSLAAYFLEDQMQQHLPLLHRLVLTPGKTSNCLGLQYLAEVVYRIPDPVERAQLMCDMVASMKACVEKQGPTAVRDGVNVMARELSRPAQALDASLRASVNAALQVAGYEGEPL